MNEWKRKGREGPYYKEFHNHIEGIKIYYFKRIVSQKFVILYSIGFLKCKAGFIHTKYLYPIVVN